VNFRGRQAISHTSFVRESFEDRRDGRVTPPERSFRDQRSTKYDWLLRISHRSLIRDYNLVIYGRQSIIGRHRNESRPLRVMVC
jgi:hypothetical protein